MLRWALRLTSSLAQEVDQLKDCRIRAEMSLNYPREDKLSMGKDTNQSTGRVRGLDSNPLSRRVTLQSRRDNSRISMRVPTLRR